MNIEEDFFNKGFEIYSVQKIFFFCILVIMFIIYSDREVYKIKYENSKLMSVKMKRLIILIIFYFFLF